MERFLLVIFLFTLTSATIDITKLRVQPGWTAQIVTSSVPDIRQMALTPDQSIIFAGSSFSNIFAVPITTNNNIVTGGNVKILLANQTWPHGVAYDATTNDLYFSSNYTSVFKFPNLTLHNLNNPPTPVVIFDKFPNTTEYPCKPLRFNHDFSRIYTAQGSPCDHCIINYSVNPPDYSGTVVSFLKNGTNFVTQTFGVRNVVGLAFNPNVENELWFTDNNRNGLGNNIPPSELNRLPSANDVPTSPPNYGFPYCYGTNFSDYTLNGTCLPNYIGAEYLIKSHVLSLGLTFVTGDTFSSGTVLIAERGSTAPLPLVGFRVVMFNINSAPTSTETVFVDGWLQNSTILGRPVDVVQMNDGSILVADELAGAIIRFYYTPPTSPSGGRGVSSLQNWLILLVCTMAILIFV